MRERRPAGDAWCFSSVRSPAECGASCVDAAGLSRHVEAADTPLCSMESAATSEFLAHERAENGVGEGMKPEVDGAG